jgi:hypothetical protein
LKIDPGLAAQSRVDDDPLQVVIRRKPDAQGFARSSEAISWRARSRRAWSSGRLTLKGRDGALDLFFPFADVGVGLMFMRQVKRNRPIYLLQTERREVLANGLRPRRNTRNFVISR